jgi:hypothetical protein
MRKPANPIQDLETEAIPSVNWKLLNQAVNQNPQLMWTSVTLAEPFSELDSRTLPLLKSIETRYQHTNANKKKTNPDLLLGCKVFWEEFRRSQLVIIFDRYADDHLLRRIYQELEAKGARTMQTLVVLGGTLRIDQKVLDDIGEVVKETNGRLKFEHLPGMKSNTPPFPHDRFAITNGEFWHFGGTVGGEMGLSGISRGWKAADIGVQKFMEDTWTVLKKGTAS